jgi:hypothetical protein
VKATGQPQTLGSDFKITTTQHFANHQADVKSAIYPSGSYFALTTVGGSVSITKLQQLQNSVTNTKTILESGDANLIGTLTGDSILGDMFYAGVLGYYAEHLMYAYLMALPQGGHLSLLATAGTYGYTPKVNYLFGLPISLTSGGIQIDLYQEGITTQINDGNQDNRFQFLLQTGVMGSALEHTIPEQQFHKLDTMSEAISAVKVIQKAAESGQRIYQITKKNQTEILPLINHDSGTMNDIKNALNNGKMVFTHPTEIKLQNWAGAGYIIIDPIIGDGAYMIGGSLHGAYLIVDIVRNITFLLASLPISVIGTAYASNLNQATYETVIDYECLTAQILLFAQVFIAFAIIGVGSLRLLPPPLNIIGFIGSILFTVAIAQSLVDTCTRVVSK